VRFAVITGGLAVTREGVIPSLPQREEVLAYHRQNELAVPSWFAAVSA
jgi:sugar/nucleoside kinase (ribokinase family)